MKADYWPEDTDTQLYRSGDLSLGDILELVKQKWPKTKLCDITISAEWTHTHCLGYDLYDPSDYTNFIVITRNK